MNIFVLVLAVILLDGSPQYAVMSTDGKRPDTFKTKEACEAKLQEQTPLVEAELAGKVQGMALGCVKKSEWDKMSGQTEGKGA